MSRPDRLGAARARASLATITTLFALAACGGGGGGTTEPPPPPPPPAVATLTVAADATTVVAGGDATALHATLTNSSATPTWTLSGPGSLSATTGTEVQYLPPDGESAEGTATVVVTAAGISKTLTLALSASDVVGHHWDVGRAATTSWRAGAYADGIYVGVGEYGGISSSPDGLHWTPHDTSESHNWAALVHAAGKWIAVGEDGSVAASFDGNVWTVTANALQPALVTGFTQVTSLAYGNGVFVASIGFPDQPGATWTSTDGTTWTRLANVPGFLSIAYGGGTFLAAGPHDLWQSPDGVHWTERTDQSWNLPQSYPGDVVQVLYTTSGFDLIEHQCAQHSTDGGKTWVGSACLAGDLPLLTDGTTMFRSTLSTDPSNVQAVAFASTTDLFSWTDGPTLALGGNVAALAQGPSTTVAFSYSGRIASGVDVSSLGLQAGAAAASPGNLAAIVQSGTTTLAVSRDGGLSIATPGSGWSTSYLCRNDFAWYADCSDSTAVVGADGTFIVGAYLFDVPHGQFGAVAYSSRDGVNWNQEDLSAFLGDVRALVNDGSRVVAIDQLGAVATRANDGSWMSLGLEGTLHGRGNGIAYGQRQYVVVGQDGFAATSADARTWTTAAPIMDGQSPAGRLTLRSVLFDGARFVAVGDKGMVVTSADGITWSVAGSATTQALHGISRAATGEYVAVGADGTVETSIDGSHWTIRNSGVPRTLNAVTATGDGFIAVGDDGVIVTSTH